jgi:hypothetical protein
MSWMAVAALGLSGALARGTPPPAAGPPVPPAPPALGATGALIPARPPDSSAPGAGLAVFTPQPAAAREPVATLPELPPLSPPPGPSAAKPGPDPAPPAAASPAAEYDPAHWYLPDCLPSRPAEPPPPCGVPGRFWVRADYLLWTTAGERLPRPLAAVVPADDRSTEGFRSGFRLDTGVWLNHAQTLGVGGGFFTLGTGERTTPITPGDGSGPMDLTRTTDLIGAEANALVNLACSDRYRIDLLGGYRFLRLDESLGLGPAGTPEVRGQVVTRNQFHGGQLGLTGGVRYGRLFADLTGKVALGVLRESAESGVTLFPPASLGGANEFVALPEADFSLGYQVSDHLRATAGYTLMYLSRAARPGEVTDAALVSLARPFAESHTGDFWAQGVSLGLEYRY